MPRPYPSLSQVGAGTDQGELLRRCQQQRFIHAEFSNPNTAFTSNHVHEVDATIFFKDRWVAKLVHSTSATLRTEGLRGKSAPSHGRSGRSTSPRYLSFQSLQGILKSTAESRIRSGRSPTRVQNTNSVSPRFRSAMCRILGSNRSGPAWNLVKPSTDL